MAIKYKEAFSSMRGCSRCFFGCRWLHLPPVWLCGREKKRDASETAKRDDYRYFSPPRHCPGVFSQRPIHFMGKVHAAKGTMLCHTYVTWVFIRRSIGRSRGVWSKDVVPDISRSSKLDKNNDLEKILRYRLLTRLYTHKFYFHLLCLLTERYLSTHLSKSCNHVNIIFNLTVDGINGLKQMRNFIVWWEEMPLYQTYTNK